MTTYAIESTTNVNGTRYTSTIEYCESRERAIERMRHFAAWHSALDYLSGDGLYFDNNGGEYGRNLISFRSSPYRQPAN